MNEQINIHKQTIINKAWNRTHGKFEFSFVFSFGNKEQYLEFQRLWKRNYAELSAMIRSGKALVKATMRRREYAGKIQSGTLGLSNEAMVQLLMLNAAKNEANRQYLAAKRMAQ